MIRARELIVAVAALLMLAAPAALNAQNAAGPPNALQGFSQNRDQPVKIDAASLEVRDKNKTATFSGNVQVVQGDTTLRCKTLAVFYDSEGSNNTMTSARPGPAGQSRIRRLEARGGVVVTQKDQIAEGETGIFDMASNTVTLSGNVIVKQGQNVLRGDRLVVDLANGTSKVEAGKGGTGRVQGLFLPSSAPGMQDKKGASDHEAPARDRREQPRETRPRSGGGSALY
ncbi:MAG TPA: LptA/OstA family protein [Xanthobacteraceae bacterium]|nr:LptA/OstA family protein [Xanthobacteraceae bacterium]